ncbi:zinc fingers and homeoboxes protein 3 isoform X1 [Poecilia latipinna]|uniref:Zinc fingers and homeoboxes 3a n=2 Tax=Poecilia latipinna TaxID=48699 RepID=A0A3B3USE1_9TELE|nr:PREDICTED: zinc fingers and homeoboxes protein 3-like isoform X1 [Poecilia latipinna]XP_014916195.1 PREDICTED: zinc fingers and homeoboxes protein 3-like isoform X1 [Poecilia latipinna]XP_014916196.1 PREDICTED: zinc fingers and homeoboxes protein 3-like isoform X1 [Poecilia latipinna]XP_014916197.1 PREDICTED: zinc fingers and homeoboxes protein 3-like isoform X1 [Poecilia latipinna]
MASKRKSTVPCMIPSKSKHAREEIVLGSLPELLPTIPEDSILSISGEESAHFSHSSSKSESSSETQKGGTYSCVTCRFESRDLNYFLDHMHNCHLDFRAQPTFYCLNCGVSVVRFEALALHNANAHPKIMEGLVTASLSVNKRDGVTTVEQSLFTDSGEDNKESGISLTKTPIAKLMKAKGEHKKIVVSHTVEVRKIDTGKDADLTLLNNVPELQNGALSTSGTPAMPRTTVTHVITTVSNQVFHQHTPPLYSPTSSDANKDLPKVMIPLSSIPTYDAAMDTSSFLKTSFGKFPYPTKAELCYLTVVSEFPEEQIKLWFTAQRLKQGISWSPEEIEEARRKMFNTVFQGGAPQKQPVTAQQVNHIVTHHTVTGLPGSKGPNFQMAKVPYSGIKPRPVGVIATQANLSTKPHVTRVSYSSPVAPPKFPCTARATQEPTKSTELTVEQEKSNGLDAAGSSGCVNSTSSSRSSSSSNCSSITNGVESRKSVNNNSDLTNTTNSVAACSADTSNNSEHCVADTNTEPSTKSNSLPTGSEGLNSTTSQVIIDNTSKSKTNCNSHHSSFIVCDPDGAHADGADDENNSHVHKTNSSSISSENCSSTCDDSVPNKNNASKPPTESTSTTVITTSNSSIIDEGGCNKDFPMKGMSILQKLIKEEDLIIGERARKELRVDPIKINFKRLKMNEPQTTSDAVHQEPKCDIEVSACHTSFSPPWGNKTPQQLQILRQAFSNTRWPSSLQYEELSIQTGLPKSEVVRWFSDSRYSHKNGQLKWLETYQRSPAESDDARSHGDTEAESQKDPSPAKKKLIEQETIKHPERKAGLDSGQQLVWQDSYEPLLALTGSETGGRKHDKPEESGQTAVLQDPWSEGGDEHQQPTASHSLIEQQTDTNQARDRLRMELLEV